MAVLAGLALLLLIGAIRLDPAEISHFKHRLLLSVQEQPLKAGLSFFGFYLLFAALSLPGTVFLNMAGGFLFGLEKGALFSLSALVIGSFFFFCLVRFFLKGFLLRRESRHIKKIRKLLRGHEIYWLFALRSLPFAPLFFTNAVMGLSAVKTSTFCFVSFLSFLPPVLIYTNIGAGISELKDLQSVTAPDFIFALSLAGLFPLLSRYIVILWKKRFKKPKKFWENLETG